VKPVVQSLFDLCVVSVEEEDEGREGCVFCAWELILARLRFPVGKIRFKTRVCLAFCYDVNFLRMRVMVSD
jgi:hypothetical protein